MQMRPVDAVMCLWRDAVRSFVMPRPRFTLPSSPKLAATTAEPAEWCATNSPAVGPRALSSAFAIVATSRAILKVWKKLLPFKASRNRTIQIHGW